MQLLNYASDVLSVAMVFYSLLIKIKCFFEFKHLDCDYMGSIVE